ncbi:helix-turn-helix domain-containing protein [Shewanella frigidimarina]|uniref:helix-turn-helix domain-containing protein n=1 Tax=Shewanella frigidimarina TaxID=56812 RepID=UPI003D79123C
MKQTNFFSDASDDVRLSDYNGDKLRIARIASGFSLVDVGAELGVTRQYAHKLENEAIPSNEQLEQLASLLNVKANFFFNQRRKPIEVEQCHFRSLRTSTQTLKKMTMAQVEIFDDSFLRFLAEEVDFPPIRLLDVCDSDIQSVSAIELIAERFRRELGLGLGPISNVIKLAESIGCIVVNLQEADERIDAFSVYNGRPIIVRNTAKSSPCRLRFDISHEIGHLIMHRGVETGCRVTESQANSFASAFLMPRSSFSAEFPKMRGQYFNWEALEDLKVRWGVSLKAILYRASKLGLITPEKAKTGFTTLARSGQAKVENGDERLTAEEPMMIQRAIDMLDVYTWTKLLQKSGLKDEVLINRYRLRIPKPHLVSI